MGYSVGWDNNHNRFIGYGVIAYCEHPSCDTIIDRGLGYVCSDGDGNGCGLFFCGKHLQGYEHSGQQCKCCGENLEPYTLKPEHPKWIKHLATDDSWKQWREENKQLLQQYVSNLYSYTVNKSIKKLNAVFKDLENIDLKPFKEFNEYLNKLYINYKF